MGQTTSKVRGGVRARGDAGNGHEEPGEAGVLEAAFGEEEEVEALDGREVVGVGLAVEQPRDGVVGNDGFGLAGSCLDGVEQDHVLARGEDPAQAEEIGAARHDVHVGREPGIAGEEVGEEQANGVVAG